MANISFEQLFKSALSAKADGEGFVLKIKAVDSKEEAIKGGISANKLTKSPLVKGLFDGDQKSGDFSILVDKETLLTSLGIESGGDHQHNYTSELQESYNYIDENLIKLL